MKKYLKILYNSDIFPEGKFKKPKKYTERQTVKAIVINKKGEIALVTNPIHSLYTLPGGGAESDNLEKEMIRECKEEISQKIKIVGIVGRTKEYRDRDGKKYITTCFVAKTIKELKGDFRTKKEIGNDLRVLWATKKKVLNIFEKQQKRVLAGKTKYYNTTFNTIRDRIFFNEWLKI